MARNTGRFSIDVSMAHPSLPSQFSTTRLHMAYDPQDSRSRGISPMPYADDVPTNAFVEREPAASVQPSSILRPALLTRPIGLRAQCLGASVSADPASRRTALTTRPHEQLTHHAVWIERVVAGTHVNKLHHAAHGPDTALTHSRKTASSSRQCYLGPLWCF